MKHIYLFNMDTTASDYGIGTYLNQVKKCFLTEREVNITLVTMMSVLYKEFTVQVCGNLRNIFIPPPRNSNIISIQLYEMDKYCFTTACLLKNYISDDDVNIFHFNFYQQETLITMLKKMFPNARTLFTVHYNNQYYMAGNEKNVSQIEDGNKQLERIISEVDFIICLSDYTYKSWSEHKYPMEKIFCLKNGLEDEYKSINIKKIKKEMGISINEFIFIFVGRLVETKGIFILIEAFKKVLLTYSRIHLLIVGDGDFKTCLNRICPYYTKISLTGRISKEELYKLYQISDVGIHPSLDEQCSYVAIEMMMHGLPIIGTNISGMDEMIMDGINGYKLFAKNDKKNDNKILEEKLYQCIIKCIEKKSILKSLGRQNRLLYKKMYSLEIMKNRMYKIYFCNV